MLTLMGRGACKFKTIQHCSPLCRQLNCDVITPYQFPEVARHQNEFWMTTVEIYFMDKRGEDLFQCVILPFPGYVSTPTVR